MAAPSVSRARVLAHRIVAQGLDRQRPDPEHLALTDLGWLDSPAGSAAQALAARSGPRRPVVPPGWVLVWGLRGAPHRHRPGDLPGLARAAWPVDGADAAARMGGAAPQLAEAGLDALDALRATAEAMARVVRGSVAKGDASAAVTRALPPACSVFCRTCDAVHVQDQLMRLAALPAGLRLEPGTSPPVLAPLEAWPGVPRHHEGGARLVAAYLRSLGPATPGDVAAYLQAKPHAVRAGWPEGLAEVRIEGLGPRPRRAWLPADQLDDLLAATPRRLVRLLPRSDPWLLARDRSLTVPDPVRRKALWPVLGQPGAVLVDGEVAGTWRSRATRRRLDVTVSPFASLSRSVQRAVDGEAAIVAGARGLDDVRVTYEEG